MVNTVIYGLDKDGKMVPSLNDPLAFVKNAFSMMKDAQVGTAAAANEAMVSLEVEAGTVLIVFNIVASYYSSASLAGRLNIVQSTTAAVGGTDILKYVIMFDPAAATAAGVAESKSIQGDKAPLFIIDNKSGSSSVFLNIEMPQFVGLALVANAITQEYSIAIDGVKFT